MNAPPATQPTFLFINGTNLEDAKSKTKRKIVRAHAARGPHSSTNTSGDAHSRPDNLRSAAAWTKHQVRKRKRERASLNTIAFSAASLDELLRREEEQKGESESQCLSLNSKGERKASVKEQAIGLKLSENDEVSPKQMDTAKSDSPRFDVIPTMPGAGWVSPFLPRPNVGKPYMPLLIDHYLSNLATSIPELDAGTPFLLRSRWFPMVITSTPTFYVVLLTAASHYAITQDIHPHQESYIQQTILHLKQQTLSSINHLMALFKKQPVSDAIIAAVAKLASYEAMFGSAPLYHMHMRALKHMVYTRGGLQALGLDGLLMRMVLWIDINAAFIHNTKKLYFFSNTPLAGHVAELEPNPQAFLGDS